MNYPQFKVGVRCFTYNQANFIIDTMNGFTMQETNFPFVCCIVDDASTDGEQRVIEQYITENFDIGGEYSFINEDEYSVVHSAQHKSNKNCFFVVFFLKHNLYKESNKKMSLINIWLDLCAYEAFCEGDDYWTDKNKLQLQVNILDNHPECSLTYHACLNVFESGFNGFTGHFGEHVHTSYSTEEILTGYHFHTATIVLRRDLFKDNLVKKIWSIMDYDVVRYFCASMQGSVIGIDRQMSVYRRNNNGISNTIHNGANLSFFFDKWVEIADCCDIYHKNLIHKTRVTQYLENMFYEDKINFIANWKNEFCRYPYYAIRLFFMMAIKQIKLFIRRKIHYEKNR